jgi:hypothetical protein
MNKFSALVAAAALAFCAGGLSAVHAADTQASASAAFRPPAVPLVTSDPYLSIWSEADHLNDATTVHWTHHPMPLVSLIRVDGQNYRLMGDDPQGIPVIPQTALKVTATRSIYQFQNAKVHVTMTFMTAALPNDLNALTRPLSYITWKVNSVDGKRHTVSIYDSAGSELAVNTTDQRVRWARETMGRLTALKVGSLSQSMFNPSGDDVRIDWGYAYLVAPTDECTAVIGGDGDVLNHFVANGTLPTADDTRMPRAVNDDEPVMAVDFALGSVGATPVERHVMVAYDELYNIDLAETPLRPYWRRNGTTPAEMLESAEKAYPSLKVRCTAFDNALTSDATEVGGARYAQIISLAYRQCLAATGISVDSHGQPLMFTKENTSNGDIATVDVIFPMDPIWVLLSPTLAKASLVPDLDYGSDPRWKYPNAPHDMGTYPVASANFDAGEGMPVEESGNMIILCDAISQDDGNANFVKPWWPTLTKWAIFLKKYGIDPGNQLCTDDFMGHLDHNANLSVKAIVALAAYGNMCAMRGDAADAKVYHNLAMADAAHWVSVADQGSHSVLAFGMPSNTWSQKYNLVWDHLLGLNVFPADVRRKEIAWYKTELHTYGVPLDSRTALTKTDWSTWSATMASSNADFETLFSPIYDYLNGTTTRDPISDSYVTTDITSSGMHARPVVGGLFIRMLSDRTMWMKWAKAGETDASNWDTKLPPSPIVTYLVPTEANTPVIWHYTTTANPPPADWYTTNFNDSGWKTGPGAFGTPVGWTNVRTAWTDTPGDIWLRRTFTMPRGGDSHLEFMVYHDEDVQIYVDGVLAAQAAGFNSGFEPLPISAPALALMKPGAQITLAVHVHQTVGGQGFDMGIANVVPQ